MKINFQKHKRIGTPPVLFLYATAHIKRSILLLPYEQSGNSINHEEIASKLLRSLKSKEDAVIESIEGYQMTDSQKYRMRFVELLFNYKC